MKPEEIFQRLTTEFGAATVFDFDDGSGGAKDAGCKVAPAEIARVAASMKTDPELHFDYLECVTGTDFPDEQHIVVSYHLYSYAKRHRMVLKCVLDRDDPVLPTVSEVWRAANWQERECFDLLGVLFDAHPDLRRIMLPDDWPGHPLRKDWQEPAEYHGIPTVRPNPVELFGISLPGDDKGADA